MLTKLRLYSSHLSMLPRRASSWSEGTSSTSSSWAYATACAHNLGQSACLLMIRSHIMMAQTHSADLQDISVMHCIAQQSRDNHKSESPYGLMNWQHTGTLTIDDKYAKM